MSSPVENCPTSIPRRWGRRHSQAAGVCTPGILWKEGVWVQKLNAIWLRSSGFGHYPWVFPEIMPTKLRSKYITPPAHTCTLTISSKCWGQPQKRWISPSTASTSLPITLPHSAAGQGCKQQQGCLAVWNHVSLRTGTSFAVLNSIKGKCKLSCFLKPAAYFVLFTQLHVLHGQLPAQVQKHAPCSTLMLRCILYNKHTYRGILFNHSSCTGRLCAVMTALRLKKCG